MEFYCFPKKQTYCSVYSAYSVFNTRLFLNFILQTSPKNSFFFRVRKTFLGHLFGKFATINIDVPNTNSEYVGIRKTNKLILVEMENKTPKCVWKRKNKGIWEKEPFLGYPIISEFSLKEFVAQEKIVIKALSEHWQNINKSIENIHGDFTHFNILYNDKNEIHIIDKREMNNSKLYDFFYFYSYLKHSINRDVSISPKTKRVLVLKMESWIKEICLYDKKLSFEIDYNSIEILSSFGIDMISLKKYLSDFYKIFYYN